jgi:PAS domain S-box-containing protein
MLQFVSRAARSETVLVALAMLLLTFGAYRALADREREQIEKTTEVAAESIKNGLSAEIAVRVRPIDRLAHRLALRPETSRSAWEDDASLFTSAYAGYQAIEWLDASYHVRWFAPALGNSILEGADYSQQDLLRAALTYARARHVVRATGTYVLPQGERGFFVAAPVFRASRLEGFVAGLFRSVEMLQSISDQALPAGYSVAVFEGKQEIFRRPHNGVPGPEGFVERELDVYGAPWRVRVWPSPQSLIDLHSSLPRLVLLAGALISALVTLTVKLATAARADSRALEEANRRLGMEISDRKQAAEALQQANDTLQAVIDTSPVAIVRMSPDGAVITWNRAAENMLGWREDEVLGRALPIAGSETPETWRARARAGQRLNGIECTLYDKNGEPLSAEVWVAAQRSTSGQISGFICMIADAGRRKQLEQQLRDSYKLDAVSRLAAGVAHNFNNMLAIITGYSHLALEELRPGDPLRDEIQEVLKAADRAARLTVQLLAFGRGQTIRPQIVDLNEVVENLRDVLQKIAGEAWEVVTPLGAELGKVRIDPEQVEQILMTLVINAREAMPGGGRIAIETANAEVGGSTGREHLDVASGLYVTLGVTDQGRGMDAQTRSHLFEPFFTGKGLGPSGLGLSSVYGIAKQNGGGVAVVSEPGRGATIEVYLPRI